MGENKLKKKKRFLWLIIKMKNYERLNDDELTNKKWSKFNNKRISISFKD